MTESELKALRARLIPIRNRMTTLINTLDSAIYKPEQTDLVESVRKQMAKLNEALKIQEP